MKFAVTAVYTKPSQSHLDPRKHKAKTPGSEEKSGKQKKAHKEEFPPCYDSPPFSPHDPLLGSAILGEDLPPLQALSPAANEDFKTKELLIQQMGHMFLETSGTMSRSVAYCFHLLAPISTSIVLGFCLTQHS